MYLNKLGALVVVVGAGVVVAAFSAGAVSQLIKHPYTKCYQTMNL